VVLTARDTLVMKIRLMLLLLAASVQPALAERPVDAGEALVEDFLTNVITMQGRFTQTLVDADGAVVEVSEGDLIIERPSRFRWTYSEPYEQWLVADGRNIWSYDVDLAQVTVKPQAEALSNTPALLLGGASDALEQFRFDGSLVANDTTWVRMRPVDESSGFDRVELGFVDDQLNRMVFFDNLEQTTDVAFYDVHINEPVEIALFDFVVPDDADLVGVPLAVDGMPP
jgi:chaperone LolA